jgi:hypothetical protein
MRSALLALALAAAAAGGGCKGTEGPVAGELSVRLTTPRNTDRAILFAVVGRQHGVVAASGSNYRVFSAVSAAGDTTHITVVALSGGGLAAGEIARLAVDDVRQAGNYTTTLIDVASADYRIGGVTGVSLTVVRP